MQMLFQKSLSSGKRQAVMRCNMEIGDFGEDIGMDEEDMVGWNE